MKTPITSGFVTWPNIIDLPPLIVEEGCENIERIIMPMPENTGTGWSELISLAVGMNIVRGGNSFTEKAKGWLIPYAHIKIGIAEPVLVISAVNKGRIIIREFNLKTDFQCGNGFVVFRHLDQIDYEIILDANSEVEGINLFIGHSALTMLLGAELAGKLLEKLDIAQIPSATVHLIPPQIAAILFSTVQDSMTGLMRRLHAQAKSLEFLSALTNHLVLNDTSYGSSNIPNSNRQLVIRQLHDELINLDGKVPSLEELSQQYSMPERVLNDEFKKMYGSSIYNYVTDQRLKSAHETLISTDTPMKTLALSMGYSHVNHFITAFRKKFGYSPGSLRKSKN